LLSLAVAEEDLTVVAAEVLEDIALLFLEKLLVVEDLQNLH
jgi:hypothetical protein